MKKFLKHLFYKLDKTDEIDWIAVLGTVISLIVIAIVVSVFLI